MASGGLPDYRLYWSEVDGCVTFYSKAPCGAKAQLEDAVRELTKQRR